MSCDAQLLPGMPCPLLVCNRVCSDNHFPGLSFTSALQAIGCTTPALGVKSLGSAKELCHGS